MSKKSINPTHYDFIPTFPSGRKRRDRIINAIVETPRGSCQKFALEPELGIIAFHSVLPNKLEWPYDYGFVPQTLGEDGDGLDVLIVNENGLFSGCLVQVRIVGALREKKDEVENDRLIGVPPPSRGAPLPTDAYYDITDLPSRELEHIKSFLVEYPALAGHNVTIRGVSTAAEAMKSIERGIRRFKKTKK